MNGTFLDFIFYFLKLVGATIGSFFACGLLVHLISFFFSRLMGRGSGAIFDVTSIIGTPVHELGHAAMCKVFGHKIEEMRLWIPKPTDGVYGYVEHSYSKRNLWSRFGKLFIGMGPLFSGLGVTVFVLWLCFPTLWQEYLTRSSSLTTGGGFPVGEIFSSLFLLFRGIFTSFGNDWLRSLLGLVVILPVSLHVSLSPQDVKESLGSLPIVLILLLVFALATFWTPVVAPILSGLALFNLRLLSLFALIIAFAAIWLALAGLVWLVRFVIGLF